MLLKIQALMLCEQVEMYVIAGELLDLGNEVRIEEGERILIEVSRKFTSEQLRSLAYQAGYCFQVTPQYCLSPLSGIALSVPQAEQLSVLAKQVF